ncbi:MAG: FHA domain-containing protein [Actinomycetota bacterium]
MSIASEHGGAGAAPSLIVWVDSQAFYGLHGHTIGREQTESITVDHAQVSRRHAVLHHDASGWSIRDMGSTNGLHDGSARRDRVALPPGRTQVWLGPPDTSPCLYFDVTAGGGGGAGGGAGSGAVGGGAAAGGAAGGSAGGGGSPPPPSSNTSYTPPQFHQMAAPDGGPVAAGAAGGAAAVGYTPPQAQQGAVAAPAAVVPGGAPPLGAPPPVGGPVAGGPVAGGPVAAQPPPPKLNSHRLTSNIGRQSQVIEIAKSALLIGRATDCDITIPDPLVSRHHARLELHGPSGRIVDLGSDNGTFVNGHRVAESPVVEGDLIEMGKAQFVLSAGRLQQYVADGLPLQADSLSVTVGGGLRILSDVSFTLPAGSMTAVIGPSGSGKSTLLNALTGRRPADTGRVLLGGRDLYASDEGLGRRIGFVPQDDPVHLTLTVRHALSAAAELRLTSDATKAEIGENVERVASELGLTERLDTRVQALSGGQRKRVSVGYELVGEPQALILDEPTSGLDPGMERDLMANLRRLADKGTTAIVVTHSVQSVELCDLVIVLAPGGRLAFIGPPDKVVNHFKCPDMASVFTLLGTRQQAEWELEFAKTTSYMKFGEAAPVSAPAPSAPLPKRAFFHDFRVLLVRYVRSLVGDRRRLSLLLLQAPLLGLLLALVLFRDAFADVPNQGARQYVLATMLAMTLLGGFNSVREIVQDRDVFRRELAVGVSANAFVLSRWLVLSVITALQAVALHLVASARQQDPLGAGALMGAGHLEMILALAGIGVATVGVGLMISASASDTPKALTMLPLVLIPLLLLSGLLVPTTGRSGIQEVTYLNPIQWGGSAAAVTVDLQRATGCGTPAGTGFAACDNPRWEPTSAVQTLNLLVLWGWSLVLLVLTGLMTRWGLTRPLRRG